VLGFSLGVYHTIKFLHVLAAVVWVGGGIFVQIYATKLRHDEDQTKLADFARNVEFFGTRVFAPASGLVLLMGITMVIYSPFISFSETWILIGLGGFVITFITGTFFLGPAAGRLSKLFETEGPSSPAVQAGMKRIFAISRIDQVVLVLVILDMVFKPGSKGVV